jgi:hypothetical protein
MQNPKAGSTFPKRPPKARVEVLPTHCQGLLNKRQEVRPWSCRPAWREIRLAGTRSYGEGLVGCLKQKLTGGFLRTEPSFPAIVRHFFASAWQG